jgi:hypothetical protein
MADEIGNSMPEKMGTKVILQFFTRWALSVVEVHDATCGFLGNQLKD